MNGGVGDLLVFRNVTADGVPDPRMMHAGLPVTERGQMDGEPLDPRRGLFAMSIETGVERLAALVLLLTCLSHIAAPRAWHDLFTPDPQARRPRRLRQRRDPRAARPACIVAFHNVWSWPGIVVTLLGWSLLLKSSAHLLFPQLAQRSLGACPAKATTAVRRYRLFGLAMLPLALAIGWIALR